MVNTRYRKPFVERVRAGLIYLTAGLLVIFLLGLYLCLPVQAGEATQAYVYDNINLMTEKEAENLEKQISIVNKATGMEIYVLTTDNAKGKTTTEFADDTFLEWGYGEENSYPGALIVIDMDNREIALSTAGHMIDYLSDKRVKTLTEEAAEFLTDKDYYGGISGVIEGIGNYVDEGIPSQGYRYDEDTGKVIKYRALTGLDILIAFGGGVLLFLTLYVSIIRTYTVDIGGEVYPIKENSNFTLSKKEDQFINKEVTRVPIENEKDSEKQSSTHSSSGGGTFGGGSSKF